MIQRSKLPKEEQYNAISHGIGALLSVFGLFVLLIVDTNKSNFSVLGILLYGSAMIGLFTASTLYHAVPRSPLKERLRILDHISIYFLIAGTYSPVTLILLHQASGWILFYVVWGIAGIGAILKLFFTGRFEFISLILYALMGWLIMFDLDSLRLVTTDNGIQLLFVGGVFYTVGIIFYAVRKIPYNHFIWHLFVLAGALCHWLFIFIDVV
ncbi:hemolysin III family protein [Maribacter chungangensis]|uniref:Hemolysin III family protein n=1 Tax=Maribacter chungangensis TaxID=1069117 RepID=A0ABW3B7G4_9FLAO